MPRCSGAKLIIALLVISLLGGFQGEAQQRVSQAEFIGKYSLKGKVRGIGGLSALELSPDGREIVLISDRGTWTKGSLSRDEAGAVTSVTLAAMAKTLDEKGKPLTGPAGDSEGITIAKDGSAYLSFENPARIYHYSKLDGAAKPLPMIDAFRKLKNNAEFEALAIDAKGRLYVLPEDTPDRRSDFPLYVYDGKWRQPFTIPRRGEFLPVGADFGPDGRFYLLERGFYGLGGFASRVRVFDFGAKGIRSEAEVLRTPSGLHDNLEGISVWRDEAGDIRLTLVSDDNHLFLLRSELVDYRLKGN